MPGPTQADLVAGIRADGVRDARVLAAFAAVARAEYVPTQFVEHAYVDEALPIEHEQVTTQPSLVAKMLEALALTGTERVLEIGTGYGFQTALLAYLAAFVWSVERWPALAETARGNLARQSVVNAEVVVGDGSEGLAEHAPYDAILVSAAFPNVPAPLEEQLVVGGRLVQPIGFGGSDEVVLFERGPAELVARRMITGARFVRLYGKHGFRR